MENGTAITSKKAPNGHRTAACSMPWATRTEELDRPLIGVVSAYSEIVPGHMNLDKLAQAVKDGVRMAGGTPILSSCHRCLRRHRHGPCGHEVFPGQP